MPRDIMLAVTGAVMAAGGLRAQQRVLPVVGLLGSEVPGSFGQRRTAQSNRFRPNTVGSMGAAPRARAIAPQSCRSCGHSVLAARSRATTRKSLSAPGPATAA
jgi:hypothetical protein